MNELLSKKNEKQIDKFMSIANSHPIWQCDLLTNMKKGRYSQHELAFIFQQHYYYSINFTRLLCLVAGHFDKSAHRAIIIENMYEEAGEEDINSRHSILMRNFLQRVSGQDTGLENFEYFTKYYVNRCIDYIKHCKPIEAAAFMAWGTEGVIPKLYQIFIHSLDAIGFSPQDYTYFQLHIECDDGHHDALASIVTDIMNTESKHHSMDSLVQQVSNAIDKSLNFRLEYFNSIHHELEIRPIRSILKSIKQHKPFTYTGKSIVSNKQQVKENILYNNIDSRKKISFNVARVPFEMESLDPRLLTILPGMENEPHKHAHETFFYIVSGIGKCYINEEVFNVEQGSMIHVPRWVVHHTENTGTSDLIILAITDYGLTGRFSENTEQSYRNNPEKLGNAVSS